MKKMLASVFVGWVLASGASGADDPRTGITKVMPPERPHPSGTLLFAIFPREGNDWKEMTATAWEFVPHRAEDPLVKRCVFLKSHWAADRLDRIGTPSMGANLVRLQVNDGPRPYSVRLYHIDYATWNVRTLYSGRQALGIGRAGNLTYLRTSEGSRILDTRSGKLAETAVAALLAAKRDRWLVELEREGGRAVALFDPRSGKVERELKDFPPADREVLLDPTGRHAVVMGWYSRLDGQPITVLPFGQPGLLRQALTLFDLERGTRRTLSTRVHARGGSGRPIIPSGPELAFAGGRLRFTSVLEGVKAGGFRPRQDEEWVVFDLKTQNEVSRQPYDEWKAPVEPSLVPGYLQELSKALPGAAYGRHHNLALAALVHHKVVDAEKARESGKIRLKFAVLSPEGDKLLALQDATLHYFDLKARTHQAVPVPPALRNVSVNACSVRIP